MAEEHSDQDRMVDSYSYTKIFYTHFTTLTKWCLWQDGLELLPSKRRIATKYSFAFIMSVFFIWLHTFT